MDCQMDPDVLKGYSAHQLDRLLVDYMLRNGMPQTATEMATSKGITVEKSIAYYKDLVDIDVFRLCRSIEEGLLRGQTTECLAWCSENRSALKKMDVGYAAFLLYRAI